MKQVSKKSHFMFLKYRSMKISTLHDTYTHLFENSEQYT